MAVRTLTLDADSAGLGHRLRRARPRGHAPGPRRGLARDVAVAQHAVSRARHERPRLGAAHRPVLGLLVRARALRAVVGAGRRDHAARPGLRLPLRRPPRRGGEHDAADAARVRGAVRWASGRPRAAPPRRCCRRSAGWRPSGARSRARPTPIPSPASCSSSPATRTRSPRRSSCCTRASPTPTRATARRAPLLRLARLRAELEFHHGALGVEPGERLAGLLEHVSDELAEADVEIERRYFGGAATQPHVVAQ